MHQEMRNAELRELLHVQVSAAAVVADGGTAYRAADKALAPPAETAPVAAPRALSAEERSRIERARGETEHLWSR